jgi:hypothetical protein
MDQVLDDCLRHSRNCHGLLHGADVLEKLIVVWLFKKLPVFYGTR